MCLLSGVRFLHTCAHVCTNGSVCGRAGVHACKCACALSLTCMPVHMQSTSEDLIGTEPATTRIASVDSIEMAEVPRA